MLAGNCLKLTEVSTFPNTLASEEKDKLQGNTYSLLNQGPIPGRKQVSGGRTVNDIENATGVLELGMPRPTQPNQQAKRS